MSDTVCIAASCIHPLSNRYFAILCSDSRIEIDGVTSGNIGQKAIGIAKGMYAMFAGNVPRCKELIDRYMDLLNDPATERSESNVLELLRGPLEHQNRSDATAYLSANYGMEYEEWLSLEASAQQSMMSGFQYWKKSCELIIIWLGSSFVRIFLITDRVEEASSFTAIGSGTNAALNSLYSRGYKTYHDIREALYYVYEAKRVSESIPGVGKETHLLILEFGGDKTGGMNIFYPLALGELKSLALQYEAFGAQSYRRTPDVERVDLSFIPGLG